MSSNLPRLLPPRSSPRRKNKDSFLDLSTLEKITSSYNQWANSVADKNKDILPLGLSETQSKDDEEQDQELEDGEDSPDEMDHTTDSEGEDVRMEFAIHDFVLEASSDAEDHFFGDDESAEL
jgi:hypothetical protein